MWKISKRSLLKAQGVQKMKTINEDLFNDFIQAQNTIAKCKITDYKLDINDFGEGKNYERINFIIPSYDAGYIFFEFQDENFDRPCLGIKLWSIEEAKNHLYTEKMKTTLNTVLADKKIWSSPLWPAGYYFYPQDWKGSSEAWLMINEDTMADKILEEMDIVFNTLKANDCFTKY